MVSRAICLSLSVLALTGCMANQRTHKVGKRHAWEGRSGLQQLLMGCQYAQDTGSVPRTLPLHA